MSQKILSVFIDESGDFGPYEIYSPYYLVSMVLHNQKIDISEDISRFEVQLQNLGYPRHAVHTGPLIRRESIYKNDLIGNRKQLFHALFHFSRKLNIYYTCIKIKKAECPDVITMTSKLSKSIVKTLLSNESFWNGFDRIILYYDNGQLELTKILTSVFNALYTNIEFRKVKPADYKLFQVADLICTLELLAEKASSKKFSASELEFDGNNHHFKKKYLEPNRKKHL